MTLAVAADEAAMQTRVRANVSAVEQILLNLVDNACKYAAGADDKRIHVELNRGDEQLTIRVCDHGPGVARDEVERVFQPFVQSRHNATQSPGGLGLGLAISRRLARSLDGELTIDEQDQRTCFVLCLPATQ